MYVHVAAVIDPEGGLLGVKSFATNLAGYKLLSGWMGTFGEIGLVGVEGTGSYGAGLARHLHREGLVVVEVDRPNRQERSRQGKSDTLDAIEAARAALSGRAFGVAKTRDGNVEAIRTLMVARRSARESRTKAVNQIRQLVYTAPDELRERFVGLPSWRIAEGVSVLRVHADKDPVRMATKSALGTLGRRAVTLGEEGKRLDVLIARLVDKVAPELVELVGLGPDTAALLLIAAGDNPSRPRSEATWAKLCGVAPLEASSGKGHPSPSQSRRRPTGQPRHVAHRVDPDVMPRRDQGLRGAPHGGGQIQKRDHAHPQALRRPGGLPLPTPGIELLGAAGLAHISRLPRSRWPANDLPARRSELHPTSSK
jgi:transposase